MKTVDRLGFHVRLKTPDGMRGARIAFLREVSNPAETRKAFVEMLQQAPPSERTRCFFRLWTLKEAYIKAIGKGLSAPLSSFAFTFEPIRIAFLPGSENANWRFAIIPASNRHVLSIATDRPDCGAIELTTRALAPPDL